LSASVGAILIGKFLYMIGLILTCSGFYILVNWDIRKSIGGRLKSFQIAGALMVSGILLMIVGYYFDLIIRPFIR